MPLNPYSPNDNLAPGSLVGKKGRGAKKRQAKQAERETGEREIGAAERA